MAEHRYQKSELLKKLDNILNKTLGELDDRGLFDDVQKFERQKGIAGAVIEQCVFGYEPDTKQEANLIIVDGTSVVDTELKTTGMLWQDGTKRKQKKQGDQEDKVASGHFVAKEPMSITAVGIYEVHPTSAYRV